MLIVDGQHVQSGSESVIRGHSHIISFTCAGLAGELTLQNEAMGGAFVFFIMFLMVGYLVVAKNLSVIISYTL